MGNVKTKQGFLSAINKSQSWKFIQIRSFAKIEFLRPNLLTSESIDTAQRFFLNCRHRKHQFFNQLGKSQFT